MRVTATREARLGLAAAIRGFWVWPDLYSHLSRNARQHYLENHTVAAAMPRAERVFLEVLSASCSLAIFRGQKPPKMGLF